MFNPRRTILTFFLTATFFSHFLANVYESNGKYNASVSLRKIYKARKKFGPVILSKSEAKNKNNDEIIRLVSINTEDNVDSDNVKGISKAVLDHSDIEEFNGPGRFISPGKGKNGPGQFMYPEKGKNGPGQFISPGKGKNGPGQFMYPEKGKNGPGQFISPGKGKNGPAQFITPEKGKNGPGQFISPEKGKNGPGQFISPEEGQNSPGQFISPGEGKNGPGQFISPEEGKNGPGQFISPEEGQNGPGQFISPGEGKNGPGQFISPEEGKNGPSQFISPEEGKNGPGQFISPEEGKNGPGQFISPEEGKNGPGQIISPEEGKNGPGQFISPEEGKNGPGQFISPEEERNGSGQFISPEEESKNNCWVQTNVKEHFKIMDELDDRFNSVRKEYQEAADNEKFSQNMLEMMLKTRGIAEREIHKAAGDPSYIPAGINIGGNSMLRLDDSILFFHRMKLRNNTHFRLKSLQNDFTNMVLLAELSLNDLHILGAYERATTINSPMELFYTPTFGEVEFLLRNVQYQMEGRYRMLRDKLAIELVVSNIVVNDILMMYQNKQGASKTVKLERKNIDGFLDRLKTDLDKWLKDYLNDYLVYFGLTNEKTNKQFMRYNQMNKIALNEFTDEVIESIKKKLRKSMLCAVRLPDFTVTAVNGMKLKLMQGVLRGLDSIYRRSLATGRREDTLRKVDATVGFSSLKAIYQYQAEVTTGVPLISGGLVVIADELIAHMGLTMSKDPDNIDLIFDSIQQIKPESLTVEGPATRVIGNMKNLLERHILTFISNAIIHNINMLRTIIKCEPKLKAYVQYNSGAKDNSIEDNENYFSPKHSSVEASVEMNSTTNNSNEKSTEFFPQINRNISIVNDDKDLNDDDNKEDDYSISHKDITSEDNLKEDDEEENFEHNDGKQETEYTEENKDLDDSIDDKKILIKITRISYKRRLLLKLLYEYNIIRN